MSAAVSIFLSGTAAATQPKVIPDVLNFGQVVVGTTETLSVKVFNSGSTSATVSSIASSQASYTVTRPQLPVTLAAGQSFMIQVVFKPVAIGSTPAQIAINGGAAGIIINGIGQSSKALYATPDSITFGSVPAGGSATSNVAITNGRSSSVTIANAVTAGSEFSAQGLSLPLTLTPGQSFTFKIAFSPTSRGSVWGTVGAKNSLGIGLLAIQLNGTGSAAGGLSVSPSSLSFGNVTVGSTESEAGTLTAAGSSVTVTSDATTSSEFTISGMSLPATIQAGQSVPYKVTFAPKTSGAASGTIAFNTGSSVTTITESVSGTGVSQQAQSVDLSWNASTSPVSGYNIYRGTTSGGPYSKLNSSLDANVTYVDSTVSAGLTYYYVTTAVNSSGQESAHSNQVQAAIP